VLNYPIPINFTGYAKTVRVFCTDISLPLWKSNAPFMCPVQFFFLGCLYVMFSETSSLLVTGGLLYTGAWKFKLRHLSAIFVVRVLVRDFILLFGL